MPQSRLHPPRTSPLCHRRPTEDLEFNYFDDTVGALAHEVAPVDLGDLAAQLPQAAAHLARELQGTPYGRASAGEDDDPELMHVACLTGACACPHHAPKPTKSQRRDDRLSDLNIAAQDHKAGVYVFPSGVTKEEFERVAHAFCASVELTGGHLHSTPGFAFHGPNPDLVSTWGAEAMAATSEAFMSEMAAEDQYVPKTIRQALRCSAKKEWGDATRGEINNLHKNETYTIYRPDDPRVPANVEDILVRMKPVFKVKATKQGLILKYKVRITADGRTQTEGVNYDDTFAPVARIETIRFFLAKSCSKGRRVKQLDFEAAFLQARLHGLDIWFKFSDELYDLMHELQIDASVIGQRGDYMLLNKSIYGLKQAGACWNKLLDDDFAAVELVASDVDHCLYHLRAHDGFEMDLALYVDDCLYSSSDEARAERVLDRLEGERGRVFDRMGDADWFLAMGIEQDLDKGTLSLSQKAFAESIVKNSMFGDLSSRTPTRTPCSTAKNVDHDAQPDQGGLDSAARRKQSQYRRMVGKLMYLARLTRPDIQFAVSRLARFATNPGDVHYAELEHLLRYIVGTTNLGLCYNRHACPDYLVTSNSTQGGQDFDVTGPTGWGDADHGGEHSTRESTSACVVSWLGAAIAWCSEKQNCVAISTTEAEIIALSRLVQEVVYTRKLAASFDGPGAALPTLVFCDNKGCLDLVANNKTNKRTKHIEIRHFYCRKVERDGHIRVARTPTERNLSDDLSKAVDWDVIKDHRFSLHGMDLHPDGSPSPTKIPNPSSKIKEPTPPTSSKKIRKPALKKHKTG